MTLEAKGKNSQQPHAEPGATGKKPDSGRFQRPVSAFFADRKTDPSKAMRRRDDPIAAAQQAALSPPQPRKPDTSARIEHENEDNRTLFPIKNENDIVAGGTATWKMCLEFGFSTLEAMQVRTAFSELARNIIKYATEGEVIVKKIRDDGIKLTFVDRGPGIEDIDRAMQYGYSSSGSLGLGLPGSKKLADKFDILSTPGKGTQVTFEKYSKTKAPRRTEAILRQRIIEGKRPPTGFKPK